MSQSPFRDDRVALLSAIEELQRENDALGREVLRLRAEVWQLRDASPENSKAVVQRLQEDNQELRARVGELEPLREQAAALRRRRVGFTGGEFIDTLERLWRRVTTK